MRYLKLIFIFLIPGIINAADLYDANVTATTSPSSSVIAGEELTYFVTVNSVSGRIKPDIEVTSTFDVPFTLTNYSGTNWTCTAVAQSVVCTLTDAINNIDSSNFTFTVTPTPIGTTTSITNTLSITGVGNVDPDTDPSNNTYSITTPVEPITDMTISLSDSQDPVLSGSHFDYLINVTNNGPYPATGIEVKDTLPAGTVYFGYSGTDWSCSFSSGVVTCLYASTLNMGQSAPTISIDVQAPLSAGTITNTATVKSHLLETNTGNNTALETTLINLNATDLSITIDDSPDPVNTASPLTYTISVTNHGPYNASDVKVIDTLPSSVNFISINGGGDWSCTTGLYIVCNYIANSGILASGVTAAPITLNVTVPATPQSLENNVTVTTSTPDVNLINNTASASTIIQSATNTSGGRDFSKYLQYNLFGDIKLIGNANVNFSGTDPNYNYNDWVNMRYVDMDGDANTFNSSSSTLDIDPNYTIVWAGLYWEGSACSDRSDGTGSGSGTGCDWSNSPYSDFNHARPHLGEVKLKTPHRSDYITVTANNLDIIDRGTLKLAYSGFADITHMLDPDEIGTYSVADITLTEGVLSGGGNFGGWAILFIYKDPSNQLHFKNVSVFNGFRYVTADNFAFDVDGFVTPLSGPVTASIALFAGDGDPSLGGVARMRVGNSSTYNYVGGDGANPTDNLLNSTIAEFGVPINPGITKTYGVDADRVDVSSFMTNDQTDTRFIFDVATPSGGVDYYTLSLFAFATDLTTPIINNFDKTAQIRNSDGQIYPAGPDALIHGDDSLIYTLEFTNTGDEYAMDVVVFDDFDFDGLTDLLALNTFDASSIKLSHPNSSSWQTNPDCGYDVVQHRVWCAIPRVEIGESYKMEFTVNLLPNINEFADTNATNTAYANYRNPTTGDYIILVSNEHGNFGGESNTFNAGKVVADGDLYIPNGMDAINAPYSYDMDRNITTKIVNSPFSLKLVYLNQVGQQTAFVAPAEFELPVILTLAVKGTQLRTIYSDASPAPTFLPGQSEIIAAGLSVPEAHQRDWIRMSFLDWNLLGWDDSGINCVQKSTTSGNYKGLPQCLSNENNIMDLFQSYENYNAILETCLGQGITLTENNQSYPCDPSSYNQWNVNGVIVPDKYNNIYGCYMCLADASMGGSRSTDDFAARPNNFTLLSDDISYPDLLRSGRDYNLTLQAMDGTGVFTLDYNQTRANLDMNQTRYYANGVEDDNGSLFGIASFAPWDFNVTDGLSVAILPDGTTNNNVVGYEYSDVGRITISIEDRVWSEVDEDDTPQDCNSTTITINGNTYPIEGSAYICGTIDTRFIPDHFTLPSVILNNHAQARYTYLSSDLNMSAPYDITINAMNADNNVTRNFTRGALYYENPVSVTLTVNHPHPVSGRNIFIKDIPDPALLGFQSGLETILWNDGNLSQRILFNYERFNNEPINPFVVDTNETSISVASTYTGIAPEANATIIGNKLNDQNATFVYGRAKPSKYFYDVQTADAPPIAVFTPVTAVVYCDLFPTCTDLPIEIRTLGQIDEANWLLSLDHNSSRGDGNITLISPPTVVLGAGAGTVTTDANIIANAQNNNVTVTHNSGALPITYDILLDTSSSITTNTWMIYNEASMLAAPIPFYKVRITGQSGWTGVGETGFVLDVNASTTETQRLNW